MEAVKTQNGLIGFFDILGYKSFLENNDVDIAVIEVLNTINNIGRIVRSKIIRSFKEPDDRGREILARIQWRVFSDTILMAMEWDEPNLYEWVVFSVAAIQLCREMFDFGLPLRGAIRSGRYLISEYCFAGRVIVDAYRAEKNINLAGCSLDEKLVGIIKNTEAKAGLNFSGIIAVPYMTPLKVGEYEKMSLLNYLMLDERSPKPNAVEIPQLVLNSFWAHHKDITADVETKARNTESFLRFLVHRFPDAFANTSVQEIERTQAQLP